MTDYLRTVFAILFCTAIICGMFPKHRMEHYVSLATGLLVVIVILSPLVKGNKILIPDLDSLQVEELEETVNVYMEETFEETLSVQIQEMLMQMTHQSFEVEVHAICDEQGYVTGVSAIDIAPFRSEYATLVANYVGITAERVGAME